MRVATRTGHTRASGAGATRSWSTKKQSTGAVSRLGRCGRASMGVQTKDKRSRSDQELEYEEAESTGAVEAWTERPTLFFIDYEHMLIVL